MEGPREDGGDQARLFLLVRKEITDNRDERLTERVRREE
jgi:hypothetical protein